MTRFWDKVEKDAKCWLWTGGLRSKNSPYGSIRINGKNVLAHRYSYEQLIGPIPEGLTLDHLCKNTRCVNPAHLEPVTLSENVRRSESWRLSAVASGIVQKAKTYCPKGHPYDLENTYVTPKGKRDCRECRRAADTTIRSRHEAHSRPNF